MDAAPMALFNQVKAYRRALERTRLALAFGQLTRTPEYESLSRHVTSRHVMVLNHVLS